MGCWATAAAGEEEEVGPCWRFSRLGGGVAGATQVVGLAGSAAAERLWPGESRPRPVATCA